VSEVGGKPQTRMATAQVLGVDREGNQLEGELVRLYESVFGGLFRYAMTIVGDKDVAQDGVQECFLRYVIARREGKPILNDKAWLYRVLRNRLLDIRKSSAVGNSVRIEEAAEYPDSRHGPEDQLRSVELSRSLRALLTARESECLQLRMDGLRYQEIAEVLRIRPGTVAAILARALKKAQELLAPKRREEC
jgi:RNA polymerase sigma-70 factor, ECF subfamily